MSKKKKKAKQIVLNEKKLIDWNTHLAGAKDKQFYSTRRIDILLITISGACIYIVFEFLKFMNTTETSIDFHSNIFLLKTSALFSAIAIVVNFLSQIFGYQANKFEVHYSREVINQLEEGITDEKKLEIIDAKSIAYNRLTGVANTISAVLMGVGIIALVIYNLLTF